MKKLLFVVLIVAILAVSVIPARASNHSGICTDYLVAIKAWKAVVVRATASNATAVKQYLSNLTSDDQLRAVMTKNTNDIIESYIWIRTLTRYYKGQCH